MKIKFVYFEENEVGESIIKSSIKSHAKYCTK